MVMGWSFGLQFPAHITRSRAINNEEHNPCIDSHSNTKHNPQ